jgi:hypothetical protein
MVKFVNAPNQNFNQTKIAACVDTRKISFVFTPQQRELHKASWRSSLYWNVEQDQRTVASTEPAEPTRKPESFNWHSE